MNTSHLQNPSFEDYKVLCHAVWVLVISILEEDKVKQREIRANTQHPCVAWISIAVLKRIWLYGTRVEQQRTSLFIQTNDVRPPFLDAWLCISGLGGPESSKQMEVMERLGISEPCLSSKAPHFQIWPLVGLGCAVSGRAERGVQVSCCLALLCQSTSHRCTSLSSPHNLSGS